jgi:hypothetical protein
MDNATEAAEDLITQIKDSTDTFRRRQCRHTMPEGGRCGSPAMRGEKFCYHHHLTRRPIADARLRQARRNAFGMPTPNSRAEIQESLGRIIARVAGNDIDLRRAGLLLYALQLASTNLTEHQRHPKRTNRKPSHPNPSTPTTAPARVRGSAPTASPSPPSKPPPSQAKTPPLTSPRHPQNGTAYSREPDASSSNNSDATTAETTPSPAHQKTDSIPPMKCHLNREAQHTMCHFDRSREAAE